MRNQTLSIIFASTVVLVTLFCAPLHSQPSFFRNMGLNIGAKGGIIASTLAGTGANVVLETDLRTDFEELSDAPLAFAIGGLSVTFTMNPNLKFRPELLYHRSGKAYTGSIGAVENEFSIHMDYLTMPLIFEIAIPANRAFGIGAYVGPHLSLMLNGRVDGLGDVAPDVELGILDAFRQDANADEEMRTIDFGVTAGGALNIKAGPGAIGFELRYMKGFIDLFDPGALSANAEEITNSAFVALVGYSINLY